MNNELNRKSEILNGSPVWNIKLRMLAAEPLKNVFDKKKKILRLQIVLN